MREGRRQRSGVDRTAALLRDLEAFEPPDEESKALLQTMLAFVRSAPDPLSRTSSTSHVTASAVIARPDGGAFLLIRHRKLEKWLQPGGHVDPQDASVFETALRESREETGVADLEPALGGRIFDVDVHRIPARGDQPGHVHYDVRHLLVSRAEAGTGQPEEVDGVAWCTLEEAIAKGVDGSLERSLRRASELLRR